MNRWAEIAELAAHPTEDGGYRKDFYNGWLSVPDRGMQMMIDHANLLERFYPALNEFQALLHIWCEGHNLPLIDEEGEPFHWSINDYAPWGDDPRSPVFMLNGYHQFSGEFCIPAYARGTLNGSLVICIDDWRRTL